MNCKGSKTPTTCIPFHTNYDYGADYQSLTFVWFLAENYVMTSKRFTIVDDLCMIWSEYILTFASHNQLYIYDCSDVVNMLCSAPGTASLLNKSSKTYRNKVK